MIAGITLRLDAPKRKLLQVTNFFYLSATNSFGEIFHRIVVRAGATYHEKIGIAV